MPNYRAFARERFETGIEIRREGSAEFVQAYATNFGAGGMYVQTPEPLPLGSRVLVRGQGAFPEDRKNITASGEIKARVQWCREIGGEEHSYGCGLSFVLNKCDLCDETVPYEDLHELKNKLALCGHCKNQIYNTDKGKIQKSLEERLLGNVL